MEEVYFETVMVFGLTKAGLKAEVLSVDNRTGGSSWLAAPERKRLESKT